MLMKVEEPDLVVESRTVTLSSPTYSKNVSIILVGFDIALFRTFRGSMRLVI